MFVRGNLDSGLIIAAERNLLLALASLVSVSKFCINGKGMVRAAAKILKPETAAIPASEETAPSKLSPERSGTKVLPSQTLHFN